jgi:uncharacterized protein YegP (UPF0339 family)
MAGKFECYKDKAGEYRFRLKAGNGETILASEGYSSKAGCENGIASVRKNCTNPDRYETSETSDGKHRFNLKASNGQVIGTSQSYAAAAGCENGIKSVAASAPDATVDEQD